MGSAENRSEHKSSKKASVWCGLPTQKTRPAHVTWEKISHTRHTFHWFFNFTSVLGRRYLAARFFGVTFFAPESDSIQRTE